MEQNELTQDMLVTDGLTAQTMGSGTLPVLATPALVAFLENTAMKLVHDLPDGTTTVPLSMGTGLAVLLVAKVIGANIMRLIQARKALREKKNETAPVAAPVTISIERN